MSRKLLKREWVVEQAYSACHTGKVPVRSGHIIPVWLAYRCLYCGEYFSQVGAEEHFGLSKIDYKNFHGDGEIKETEIIEVKRKRGKKRTCEIR